MWLHRRKLQRPGCLDFLPRLTHGFALGCSRDNARLRQCNVKLLRRTPLKVLHAQPSTLSSFCALLLNQGIYIDGRRDRRHQHQRRVMFKACVVVVFG
jgi:hypothetical protein